MSRIKISSYLKGPGTVFKPIVTLIITLLFISLLTACAPAAITSAPVTTAQAPTSTASATTTTGIAKPRGELVAALPNFGSETFIPWKADSGASQLCDLVYDVLIYYDIKEGTYIPGLAESWELSSDAMTLTYHLRKGVQWQEGWGEMTADDIKYNFEKQAGKDSIGQTSAARNVASMDIPDPYTLVIHMKKPGPTFFMQFTFGNTGNSQGIVSKKYLDTVGEDTASRKPVGTGPFKLLSSQVASYYTFEALDSHWRVVPEFKTLTLRNVPEISTTVAMLKTKEIDLANVSNEQLSDLKAAGLATESYSSGNILNVQMGGMVTPEDSRYDPNYHNKDPWVDPKVRRAMCIAIDRDAICKAIFAGGANPAGVPQYIAGAEKYQYQYDPAAAKQLLAEAGYPKGFSFRAISYVVQGLPETPRVMEALASYWQQIGLEPKIATIDYASYSANRNQAKTAGDVALVRITFGVDLMDKNLIFLMPDAPALIFEDEGSYAIWKEGSEKVSAEERMQYSEKLLNYYYETVGPIPLVILSNAFAWNSAKIAPFPHSATTSPYYLEYVRHAQPLNTFRLFTPWAGR